jgi:hypothetical protein
MLVLLPDQALFEHVSQVSDEGLITAYPASIPLIAADEKRIISKKTLLRGVMPRHYRYKIRYGDEESDKPFDRISTELKQRCTRIGYEWILDPPLYGAF